MDDSSSDYSSSTRFSPLTRRRLLGTGGGIASALGIGVGVRFGAPRKVQASGGTSTDDTDSDSDSDTAAGLYAVATNTDGSSENSRVALGTLGHHHVWANTSPSELHFNEASAGTQLWRFDPDDRARPPTVVEGTVFVSSGDNVYALDAETAEEQWRFETDWSVNSSPTVVDIFVVQSSRVLVFDVFHG